MNLEYTYSEYYREFLDSQLEESYYGDGSWTDGETVSTALQKMANGDDTYAHMADELLERISDVTEGVPRREWTPSPYGAYPVVSEYLSGMPECMRTQSPSGEVAPVKIVVSTTCSGGIDKETMTRRGVAILAFVMKLQQVRPVELYLLGEFNHVEQGYTDNLFTMVKVDSKPLSIAHACFCMANVGFARALTYQWAKQKHGWLGDWPKSYREAGYDTLVRRECEMSPEDLWISSSYLHDGLLMSDPVAWVNEQLRKYGIGDAQ